MKVTSFPRKFYYRCVTDAKKKKFQNPDPVIN